ncbi:MAG: cation diffusion facilitator family transporter [Planctomycetia bacterium]|nr:cation diffusion facilitator family transporter [Planctomycetia bacterium]
MLTKQRSEESSAQAIQLITLWGALANFLLVLLKLAAGIWGHSQVLVADAIHSLSDLMTDAVVLIGVRFWQQPADQEHPYGHAKVESLVTLFIGSALLLAGGNLIYEAVVALQEMFLEKNPVVTGPGWIALAAAILSILIKEFLYQVTANVGRQCHSSAVVANAWHHRTDALSSIPAALTVGGIMLGGPMYSFLDPVGTILVGGMILYAAWLILYPTLGTLLDAGTTLENIGKIEEIVLSCPGTHQPHRIRTRSLGNNDWEVDLHIRVRPDMTVRESHSLSHLIERKLLDSPLGIVDVIIHIEPMEYS